MQRDSFVFYESFSKAINILPEANQLHAYKFITDYGLYGVEPEPELDPLAYAIFVMARPQMDANNKKFINWKKWWRPVKNWDLGEKPKDVKDQVNQKPNVNANENDNVNANDNAKQKQKKINKKVTYSKEFDSFRAAYPKKKWKQKAREAWENAIKWGNDPKVLITKAWEYATEIKLKRIEDHYIKFAQWWLNDWRFDDDYFTGKLQVLPTNDEIY